MARGLYVGDQLPPLDTAARAAVNTFTAAQDVYGAPQKILPKSRQEVGLTLDLEAYGTVSTTGSPTFSVGFGIGASALSATGLVVLAQTQLAAYPVATVTLAPWHIHWQGVLRAIGPGATGGSFYGSGYADLANTVTPFSTIVTWVMPTTDALKTVGFDCTADRALNVIAQWGTSSASNSVVVQEFVAKATS